MRYIFHPPDITFLVGKHGEKKKDEKKKDDTISFLDFIDQTIGSDPKSATTVSTLRKITRVIDAIDRTKPGETAEIDADDWRAAADVLETPSGPYATASARHLLPFFDAVLLASTEPPPGPPPGRST